MSQLITIIVFYFLILFSILGYGRIVTIFNSDYQAKENIYAAYAMGEYNLGKLSIVGGLRYELTEIEHKGNVLKLEKGRFFRDLFEEQKNLDEE